MQDRLAQGGVSWTKKLIVGLSNRTVSTLLAVVIKLKGSERHKEPSVCLAGNSTLRAVVMKLKGSERHKEPSVCLAGNSMLRAVVIKLNGHERHKEPRVRLAGNSTPQAVVIKLKGSGQTLKRAQILLKAKANGPGWTDQKNAEAFDCRS